MARYGRAARTDLFMAIEQKNGFLVQDSVAHVPCVYLETKRLQECLSFVRAAAYLGVAGTPGYGFAESTLDSLLELPPLEAVWFTDINLKDISALYRHSGLRFFGVHERRPPIDFARFPELNTAVWVYSQRDSGLRLLQKLKQLDLWRLTKAKRLLELPDSLESLTLNWPKIAGLRELPSLPNLRTLEINRARSLVSLDGIDQVSPGLEKLVVTGAPHLETPTKGWLRERLPRVAHASLQGNLVISRGAE